MDREPARPTSDCLGDSEVGRPGVGGLVGSRQARRGGGPAGAAWGTSVQMPLSESDSGWADGYRSLASARLAWVWAGVAAGTAVATVVDRVVGGLDGRPALFLLVILALPFWDRLPPRIGARLAELVVVVVAVAVLWFALAAVRPEVWWRAEIAYGIACGIAGTAHALLGRRRTV